jgi:hypothetical protein
MAVRKQINEYTNQGKLLYQVMKTFALLLFSGFIFMNPAHGQDLQKQLYWVIESNINIPNSSIVKIYDQHNLLVHEIKLDRRLNISKRRHRKELTRIVKRYSQR